MEVKDLDFSDSVFQSQFVDYCINSKPLPRMSENSLSMRLSYIYNYRNELCRDSEFKYECLDDDNQAVLYSFFSLNKEKDSIIIDFIFPNTKVVFVHDIAKYQEAFCESFLRIYEDTGLTLVTSPLIRRSKRNSLVRFLTRFCPPFTFIENEKGQIHSVEVDKNNVISFYEKVKSKSDRN